MHKLAVIKDVFSETMQKEKYAGRFCVLLFLIIKDANVNALSLTSCDNPLENEVCNLTCTTTDHSLNVAFNKQPDASSVGQCVADSDCFGSSQYSISQPNSTSTVLSFIHSRNISGLWRCSYGPMPISVSVPWATYPKNVSTTLTSNTTVDTNIDGNVTLECLYSEQAPTVTLQYEGTDGNNDAIYTIAFQCYATDSPCTDVDFTTYECPVIVKKETGIDYSDTYSIKLKIKVSHVQTEDVHTIVTDITFKSPTTTTEQQTTTKKTNDGSTDYAPIIIGTVFVVIVIITICFIVLFKNRNNKRDQAKTTNQDNSNKTSELTENKLDTFESYGYAT